MRTTRSPSLCGTSTSPPGTSESVIVNKHGEGQVMERDRNGYVSPLSTRYASKAMQYLFSENNKFRTWRAALDRPGHGGAGAGAGYLPGTDRRADRPRGDINYDEAEAREKLVRHDVMSHVYAYGLQCPKAAGIITWGPPAAMWGQYGHPYPPGTPWSWSSQVRPGFAKPLRLRGEVQGSALSCLHPPPARPS